MDNLGNALTLMVIGMLTVFVILTLVVLIGKVIIRITNKYWPAVEVARDSGAKGVAGSSSTIAAIVAAVDTITNGKGKVTNIKKL